MGTKRFTDQDLIAALTIHEGNVTHAAEELGVTRAAVVKRKNKLPKGIITPDVDTFRRKRADVFAELQKMLLQYVTPDKLKKASLAQIGTLFGIFYDKERLELGKATEHIAHAHYEKLDLEDKELIKQLIQNRTEKKLEAIEYEDAEYTVDG